MSAIAVEPWELRSELVFVSREVFEAAVARMPDRDPYAFLDPHRGARAETATAEASTPALAAAVGAYTLRRSLDAARTGSAVVAALALLAALAELVR